MKKSIRRVCGALVLVTVAGTAGYAVAQRIHSPIDRQIDMWCANNGQWIKVVTDNPWVQYAWYALMSTAGASLIANARGSIEKHLPWLMPVIDFAALNWREILARLPSPPAIPSRPPQQGAPKQ